MTALETKSHAAEARFDAVLLLRRQDALYSRLEDMAVEQRCLVTREDTGPLLALLADRQRLSTELLDVAAQLEPIRRDWPVYRAGLTSGQRLEADGLVARTAGRMRRVIESDERDARLLSARRALVRNGLQSTHASSMAIRAYQAPAGCAGRLDRTDEESP